MVQLKRLKPTNRHLLIVPHVKSNETNTGVLLPEDYDPGQDPFIEATVIDIADDCAKQFKHLTYGTIGENKIVVDRSMIQEINLKDSTHYLILENYVMGFFRSPDAH